MERSSTSDAALVAALIERATLRIERIFCPLQRRIVDVPVYVWRYSRGLAAYLNMMDALEQRQIDISPFVIPALKGVTVPVTPLVNPVTGFSSHFIIRMIDEEDDMYKVDCLIRDSDLYFMGFRRWLKLDKGKHLKGWSRWYRFKETDMILPGMFDAIKLPVTSGYLGCEYVRPGGVETIRTMFKAFAHYPEGTVQGHVLQMACFCFMATVPESRRLRSVNRELIKRVSHEEPPSSLPETLYRGMHSWGNKGETVLENRRDNRLLPYHLLPDQKWFQPFNLVRMGDLIGEKGEMLLINNERSLMGIPESEILQMEEQALQRNVGSAHRKDPGFRKDYAK